MKEYDAPEWKTTRAQLALSRPEVHYVPLEWCKYGLISNADNKVSGIATNVDEVAQAITHASDALRKLRG